jgi:hypothetical protein
VKRWLDRGFDPEAEAKDLEPTDPVRVERIEQMRNRRSYGLPILIGGLAALALGAALLGHFGAFSSAPAPEPSTPLATPIAWVDATAAPTPSASPTAEASAGETSSNEATSASSPSGPTTPLVVRALLSTDSNLWHRGEANHFTVQLTNATAAAIPLSPCPAYRMYLTGLDSGTAPIRLLNCNALGWEFLPGETLLMDMVYTPALDDPIDAGQLVWQWMSPDWVQAIATLDVSIGA